MMSSFKVIAHLGMSSSSYVVELAVDRCVELEDFPILN